MSDFSNRLRRLVENRAGGRCEYCRLAQEGQEATFHIDHIVQRVAGGPTVAENLAAACVSYSLRKAAQRSAPDSLTGRRVALLHPRRQRWARHFQWRGFTIVGRTPTGRATVAALEMNRPLILAIRQEEAARGSQPPP